MKLITRKSEVRKVLTQCLEVYEAKGLTQLVDCINQTLLQRKVKFPLLEFCAHTLHETVPDNQQIELCDQIEALKTEGGNVLLGILLQRRLNDHFLQSFQKAREYIMLGEIWYVCDIIGERVFGYSLLTQPEKTIPEFKKMANHPSHWVVRSLGAGSHYAIKKGLNSTFVKSIFALLLTMATTNNKEVRQGVGWAAKTTAKFHPSIIEQFDQAINNEEKVANWFRTKINIGLERHRHAKGN